MTNQINIDDLTLGQIKQLKQLFANDMSAEKFNSVVKSESPFIGQHCIVRTFSAGVHMGTVMSVSCTEVVLKNARRLWKWDGAFTLSEVAMSGVKQEGTRIAVEVPMIGLLDADEIIPTTDTARKTFEAIHEKS